MLEKRKKGSGQGDGVCFIIKIRQERSRYDTVEERLMKAVVKQERQFENLHYLHKDSTGIICVSQIVEGKWTNRYYNYKSLCKTIHTLDSYEELFFSQNTFKKFRRSTEYLFELKACYIDLDYYKMNLTKEQTLFGVDHLVSEKRIPIPSMIIDSGHGLYLIWRIKRIPAMAVKLWRAIEEYLFWELKDLGADKACLDPTRVFRIVGSINSKYPIKQKVQVLSTYPIEYDLHDLQERYLKFKKQPSRKKRNGKLIHIKNIYTMYCNRREDILSLCKIRNFEMTGLREITLFLYRYYGCLQYTDDKAIDMVKELNSKFTKPCKEGTVLRATRSAEKASAEEKYNYKNSTLVELLKITDEEMKAQWPNGEYVLQTIITKDEKYRRNNIKRKNKRRNSQGNTDKEQSIQDNLEIIKTLKEQGYKQKQIAKETGMTVRNVQKYYKMLRDADGRDGRSLIKGGEQGAGNGNTESRKATPYQQVN